MPSICSNVHVKNRAKILGRVSGECGTTIVTLLSFSIARSMNSFLKKEFKNGIAAV